MRLSYFLKRRSRHQLFHWVDRLDQRWHAKVGIMPDFVKQALVHWHASKQTIREVEATQGLGQALRQWVSSFTYSNTQRLIALLRWVLSLWVVLGIVPFSVIQHQVVPTGSMRPTIRELDRMLVSKTTYGINKFWTHGHLLLSPELLHRGDIVAFTAHDLPLISNQDTALGFIPTSKTMVKRLVALPGDRVWFYGGTLWTLGAGQDKLCDLNSLLPGMEYIPFRDVQGRARRLQTQWQLEYFNQIVLQHDPSQPPSFLPLPWGMDGYAPARLLTASQAGIFTSPQESAYYLELFHHPVFGVTSGRSKDLLPLTFERSLLPLEEAHLRRLQDALYTQRFHIARGRIYPFEVPVQERTVDQGIPLPLRIPTGTYEFEAGKAYLVSPYLGRTQLPEDHPLYKRELIPFWYNLGASFHPSADQIATYRYVYYDRGTLKTMGQMIMESGDPLLDKFIDGEKYRKEQHPFYKPFLDPGPPTPQQVGERGLLIPNSRMLCLGDNHAASLDSRDFGPVPIENVVGSPLIRFWPPSSWQETLKRPVHPWSPYSLAILSIVIIVELVRYWRLRIRRKKLLNILLREAEES